MVPTTIAEQRGGAPGSVVSTEHTPPKVPKGITEEGNTRKFEPAVRLLASAAEPGWERKTAGAAACSVRPVAGGAPALGSTVQIKVAAAERAPIRGRRVNGFITGS